MFSYSAHLRGEECLKLWCSVWKSYFDLKFYRTTQSDTKSTQLWWIGWSVMVMLSWTILFLGQWKINPSTAELWKDFKTTCFAFTSAVVTKGIEQPHYTALHAQRSSTWYSVGIGAAVQECQFSKHFSWFNCEKLLGILGHLHLPLCYAHLNTNTQCSKYRIYCYQQITNA